MGKSHCRSAWLKEGNLDDALQALLGLRDTSAGTHRGQENKEKFDQVHPHRRGVVQTQLHPPYFGMCKRRAVCMDNARTPQRDMRGSYRWSIFSIEGHSCGILLANHKGRLHKVCTAVYAMSATLAQGVTRRAQIDLQPLAVPYLENRITGTFPLGDTADEVLRGRHRVFHEVDRG